jgi:hypothetical protein
LEVEEALKIGERVQIKATNEVGSVTAVVVGRSRIEYKIKLDEDGSEVVKTKNNIWYGEKVQFIKHSHGTSIDRPILSASSRVVPINTSSGEVIRGLGAIFGANAPEISDSISIANNHKKANKKRKKTFKALPFADNEDEDDGDDESSSSSSSEDDDDSSLPLLDGIRWNATNGINDDTGHIYKGEGTFFRWEKLNRELGASLHKSPIHYFYLMYPMDAIPRIVAATNARLAIDKSITKSDFLRYLGIRLAFAIQLFPKGIYMGGFGTRKEANAIYLSGMYGKRFGMSRDRHQEIESKLTFCEFDAHQKQQVLLVKRLQQQSLISYIF